MSWETHNQVCTALIKPSCAVCLTLGFQPLVSSSIWIQFDYWTSLEYKSWSFWSFELSLWIEPMVFSQRAPGDSAVVSRRSPPQCFSLPNSAQSYCLNRESWAERWIVSLKSPQGRSHATCWRRCTPPCLRTSAERRPEGGQLLNTWKCHSGGTTGVDTWCYLECYLVLSGRCLAAADHLSPDGGHINENSSHKTFARDCSSD